MLRINICFFLTFLQNNWMTRFAKTSRSFLAILRKWPFVCSLKTALTHVVLWHGNWLNGTPGSIAATKGVAPAFYSIHWYHDVPKGRCHYYSLFMYKRYIYFGAYWHDNIASVSFLEKKSEPVAADRCLFIFFSQLPVTDTWTYVGPIDESRATWIKIPTADQRFGYTVVFCFNVWLFVADTWTNPAVSNSVALRGQKRTGWPTSSWFFSTALRGWHRNICTTGRNGVSAAWLQSPAVKRGLKLWIYRVLRS